MKVKYENSLEYKFPIHAKEFNTIKNNKSAAEIGTGNHNVWWICDKGHEWKTNVSLKTRQNTSCPYCNHKLASSTNNLAIYNPNICLEWNFSKNNLPPENYLPFSNKKVWWICEHNHEWEAIINSRSNGMGNCPKCSWGSAHGALLLLKTIFIKH